MRATTTIGNFLRALDALCHRPTGHRLPSIRFDREPSSTSIRNNHLGLLSISEPRAEQLSHRSAQASTDRSSQFNSSVATTSCQPQSANTTTTTTTARREVTARSTIHCCSSASPFPGAEFASVEQSRSYQSQRDSKHQRPAWLHRPPYQNEEGSARAGFNGNIPRNTNVHRFCSPTAMRRVLPPSSTRTLQSTRLKPSSF